MPKEQYTQSAGGVVFNPSGKIALIKQTGNVWKLPMGHVEQETPVAAARREIFEETGLTRLNLVRELGRYKRFKIGLYGGADESEIKIITIYLFTTPDQRLKPHDNSIIDSDWFTISQAYKRFTNRKDQEFFKTIGKELHDFAVEKYFEPR